MAEELGISTDNKGGNPFVVKEPGAAAAPDATESSTAFKTAKKHEFEYDEDIEEFEEEDVDEEPVGQPTAAFDRSQRRPHPDSAPPSDEKQTSELADEISQLKAENAALTIQLAAAHKIIQERPIFREPTAQQRLEIEEYAESKHKANLKRVDEALAREGDSHHTWGQIKREQEAAAEADQPRLEDLDPADYYDFDIVTLLDEAQQRRAAERTTDKADCY